MNLIVAGIAGGVLAAITAFGGVAAYVGTTTAAPSDQLTQYADK
jgi:hypothetical protein